ncbi:MAG: XRE family transcriptional regulator [Desulfobacteraceae bacterium]|jgi:transcriptional regulator with XRE-family HTH domain|nr:MAG: XRE family transcriptional regulator [Desulfobacteraceae bacterium]
MKKDGLRKQKTESKETGAQHPVRDAERDFLDSIGGHVHEEDFEAHVGEKVKAVREARGLSLKDISQRTDLDPELLEQIEQGSLNPPLGTVIKLAKALDMKMGYLISGEENRPYTIVRKDDRKVVSRYDSKKGKYYGYQYESLAPHKKDRRMEPFLVTLEPSNTKEERSSHDGQEFIFVLNGNMEVWLEKEVHVLGPGDAIYYDSSIPHLVKCHGKEATRILAVLNAGR